MPMKWQSAESDDAFAHIVIFQFSVQNALKEFLSSAKLCFLACVNCKSEVQAKVIKDLPFYIFW
jgi:hypothetical protein